jgi:hypothetical protein
MYTVERTDMTVFDLDRHVVGQYEKFARSFTEIQARDILESVDKAYKSGRYWPEPMIQINPRFKPGMTVGELVRQGSLTAGMEKIFQAGSLDGTLKLHQHQIDALTHASVGKSFVVTTGTGSGKSLCYFVPIIDRILKAKAAGEQKKTRAIIIYPMNALANSQYEELDKRVRNTVFQGLVTYSRYTGQDSDERRQATRREPPDILLTNFMMLELLLTRQAELDRDVIANCEGLEFLVLDELHTYRGRQGADVAMLVRRVRERLETDGRPIQCIGTSATMASEGTKEKRQEKVAKVASTLFATDIEASSVVTEELQRVTAASLIPKSITPANLQAAIKALGDGKADDAALKNNSLMAWIEMTLGLLHNDEAGRLERAEPLDLTKASALLAAASGMDAAESRNALEAALELASRRERDRGGQGDNIFFPIRLHRFISGAGKVYATLEPAATRQTVLDGQLLLPGRDGTVRLYPTYFCRTCGQEHHPVTRHKKSGHITFLARDIDEVIIEDTGAAPADEAEEAGFLTPVTSVSMKEFDGSDVEHYPDEWRDTKGDRLKATYRRYQLLDYIVNPAGIAGGDGMQVWFQPGKFRFCPACREVHSTSGRDINRLAGLTAEGRSSATTTLVGSVLSWMKVPGNVDDEQRRKILGFSDNRQDTALQAGHYNDFVFIALLRGATLAALKSRGGAGVSDSTVGRALASALGFTVSNQERQIEWLADSDLDGAALEDAAADLASTLAHRFWFDQRRGWRHTFPNLEQLGLIQVRYKGLERLAQDDQRFVGSLASLRQLKWETRQEILGMLLNVARQGLAVRSDALSRSKLEELQRRRSRLTAPWGFSDEERAKDGGLFFVGKPPETRFKSEETTFVRTGMQSALGKKLRRLLASQPKMKEYDDILRGLVRLLSPEYLVEVSIKDHTAYRLAAEAVEFHVATPATGANAYFVSLYETIAEDLLKGGSVLFGNEAREHTAQVDQERRQFREKRFRYGQNEVQELATHRTRLRQLGESGQFLPVLFCSPTMELGVDISELDAVYLRNVPPTPANYAQRSGRAGRGGSAALVLTYCSAQSPHDQFFFNRRHEMIQGVVKPPAIDLANQDMIRSHLNAVWLAQSGKALGGTIAEIIEPIPNRFPMRTEIATAFTDPVLTLSAAARMSKLTRAVADQLGNDCPDWLSDPKAFADLAAQAAWNAFSDSFARWRNLLSAAHSQLQDANRTLENLSIRDTKLRSAASIMQGDAKRQIDLLLQGKESGSGGDFSTYRYLATEGFLPGYNFPRLPLMAFIPGQGSDNTRRREAFVQRPRFLGISEFGPHSRIYHEGRAYRVVRLQVPASDLEPTTRKLITEQVWLCRTCGARDDRLPERCHVCESNEGWDPIPEVKRVENVATHPAEHITANDEERQRQGFDIVTTFRWPRRSGYIDMRVATAVATDGTRLLDARYAPAATLQRLNKGLKRRKDQSKIGFDIEVATGKWLSAEDAAGAGDDVEAGRGPKQTIVPMVEDHKNTILLKPVIDFVDPTAMVVLQHALLRGIEAEFQLEEGEVLSEPMPSRADRRQILLYEATEGGAGVLARLVRETDALSRIARQALTVMHFSWATVPTSREHLKDEAADRCKAGCYRCLLTYFNQPDHEDINRHNVDVIDFLCRLANSTSTLTAIVPQSSPTFAPEPADPGQAFAVAATAVGLPAPKVKASGQGWQVTWPAQLVVGLLGPVTADRQTLESMDYRVFEIQTDPSRWAPVIAAIKLALEAQP